MYLTAKPFPKVDAFYLHIAPLICWALQNKSQALIIIVPKYVQIFDSMFASQRINTHTHTHTYIYIYFTAKVRYQIQYIQWDEQN